MALAGRDCEDATGDRRRFAHLFGSHKQPREDLSLWRLCMVVAGFAPLFVLLTVRGIDSVPDKWLWVACAFLVLGPMLLMAARLFFVFRFTEPSSLYVDDVEESRSHLVVYLFATLLPFYRQSLVDIRDLVAVLLALALIVFIFWRLNLHYVNILLVVFGFNIYTICRSAQDQHPFNNRLPVVVVIRDRSLSPKTTILGYRLSDTLWWGLPS